MIHEIEGSESLTNYESVPCCPKCKWYQPSKDFYGVDMVEVCPKCGTDIEYKTGRYLRKSRTLHWWIFCYGEETLDIDFLLKKEKD